MDIYHYREHVYDTMTPLEVFQSGGWLSVAALVACGLTPAVVYWLLT